MAILLRVKKSLLVCIIFSKQVSLTEEVCETCNEQGGVCIKSSDRHCFGDPSFEGEWVKYCIPDGKDYVKREENGGKDASLVNHTFKVISLLHSFKVHIKSFY